MAGRDTEVPRKRTITGAGLWIAGIFITINAQRLGQVWGIDDWLLAFIEGRVAGEAWFLIYTFVVIGCFFVGLYLLSPVLEAPFRYWWRRRAERKAQAERAAAAERAQEEAEDVAREKAWADAAAKQEAEEVAQRAVWRRAVQEAVHRRADSPIYSAGGQSWLANEVEAGVVALVALRLTPRGFLNASLEAQNAYLHWAAVFMESMQEEHVRDNGAAKLRLFEDIQSANNA